jgi:ribose transport system ATP-binding protein
MTDNVASSCLLAMHGISKSFAGVQALKDVSFNLRRGEVHVLIGENGAGKSTLIKVLGGAHLAESGEILLDGEAVRIASPMVSQQLGISIIYQEFNLIPELTVCENIFLGREKTRHGFINGAAQHAHALELFKRIGIEVDPTRRCRDLTIAQQQTVEIAKALAVNAQIIVMDEPSAALSQQEVAHLFGIIRDLKAQGIGIIYISHRLDEIFEIGDRITVLRDGELVRTQEVKDTSRATLIEMMVGRPLDKEFPEHQFQPGRERLRVQDLCRGNSVRKVSFSVRAGEILAFAGLIGAGRTETMRVIFGADQPDSGHIFVDGVEVRIGGPRDAIGHRICLLTEDRKNQGLVLIHSVQENFGLPNLDRYVRRGLLGHAMETTEFAAYVAGLKIRIAGPGQLAQTLSGGNQQKVVLAKWLATNADIFIFDEPTRGIDVGAKYEIYLLMHKLADEGKAIIMISSELPEVLGMSNRILVMHEGRIRKEITDVANARQEDILSAAMT